MKILKLTRMFLIAGVALSATQSAVAHPLPSGLGPSDTTSSDSTSSSSSSSQAYLSLDNHVDGENHYQYVYEFVPVDDAEIGRSDSSAGSGGLAGFLSKTFSGSSN